VASVLVTGSAGFIGFHLAQRLLADGHAVVGFDGLTDYYDVRLKHARHAILAQSPNFRAVIGMLESTDLLRQTVAEAKPEFVIHLAAQAGVRYSIEQPQSYISTNLDGTFHLLEALRAQPPKHLLLASTSSVYGAHAPTPFVETDRTDYPLSIYAATKRGGEALSHSYAALFRLPTTCLRFFTVYGPWGRPDMAALKFADAIAHGRAIEVYGHGRMSRDFTYVADVVEAVTRLLPLAPTGQPVHTHDTLSPAAPWRVVNIAGGAPVALDVFIGAFEAALGRPVLRTLLPMQPGDVSATAADVSLLRALVGYVPATPVAEGVAAVVDWYRRDWARLQT
jgi:UDP-glucuronate 4-epimerase